MTLRQLTASALFILAALVNTAHADGTYRIDLVVFEQPDAGAASTTTRSIEMPEPHVNMQSLGSNVDMRFLEQGLPEESLQTALTRFKQKGVRVLRQLSWIQPGLSGEEARAVAIEGGDKIGEIPELTGYVKLTHEEIPLLETRLGLIVNQTSPARPVTDTSAPPAPTAVNTPPTAGVMPSPATEPAEPTPIERVMLRDTRRLPPDTLTYVDHPRFGMLIRCARQGTTPTAQ